MKFGLKIAASSNAWALAGRFLCGAVLGLSLTAATPNAGSSKAAQPKKADSHRATTKSAHPKPKNKIPTKKRTASRRKSQTSVGFSAAPPNTPAARYAGLSTEACYAELHRRQIHFRIEENAPGVRMPIRLLGPLHGVLFRSDLPDRERAHCPWEVFDCRLALSVDDFAEVLARHDVVEARIFSAWRPAKQGAQEFGKRHPAALAVDVRALKKANGEELVVLKHFEGHLGEKVCDGDRQPETAAGRELLAIVCESARGHFFNSMLTPNFNAEHKNHFHLELTLVGRSGQSPATADRGVSWFMLQ